MRISVLIADDHAPFRALVAETVHEAGMEVCGHAATAQAAVDLAVRERPDICLVDIRMPGDGVLAARRIVAALPETRVLMLTVSAESDDVLDALQAGATGYLVKGRALEGVVDAIRAVVAGDAIVTPAITRALVDEIRRTRARHVRTARGSSVQLTEREWRVLELLDDGSTTVEIARELYVAPVTVRTHIAAVVRKLEAQDRREALALYRGQRAPRA